MHLLKLHTFTSSLIQNSLIPSLTHAHRRIIHPSLTTHSQLTHYVESFKSLAFNTYSLFTHSLTTTNPPRPSYTQILIFHSHVDPFLHAIYFFHSLITQAFPHILIFSLTSSLTHILILTHSLTQFSLTHIPLPHTYSPFLSLTIPCRPKSRLYSFTQLPYIHSHSLKLPCHLQLAHPSSRQMQRW